MKRRDNEFVIRAIEVRQDLQSPDGKLPVFRMEYCAGGDLRKVSQYFFNKHITYKHDIMKRLDNEFVIRAMRYHRTYTLQMVSSHYWEWSILLETGRSLCAILLYIC